MDEQVAWSGVLLALLLAGAAGSAGQAVPVTPVEDLYSRQIWPAELVKAGRLV